MSKECNHACSSCKETCEQRTATLHPKAKVKKTIGIVSAKGGVGKSFVTSLLAVKLAKEGKRVAILDADILGPSIAHSFGIETKAMGDESVLYPARSKKYGIQIISSTMLLKNDSDPIIWRGSMVSNLVLQFYSQVLWDEVDVLLIDMPPGTGDVALTTMQMLPLDGLYIVTTPQEMVTTIVGKAIHMAEMLGISILGIVENMAYVRCPACDEKIYIYGERKEQTLFSFPILTSLPIDPILTQQIDQGEVESCDSEEMEILVDGLEHIEEDKINEF